MSKKNIFFHHSIVGYDVSLLLAPTRESARRHGRRELAYRWPARMPERHQISLQLVIVRVLCCQSAHRILAS
jgi:hypothetical protein